LEPDTLLNIDHLGAGTGAAQDVELDLRAGQIAGNIGRLPSGSRYEIKFSKGVAGVRSGIFHINASGVVAVPAGETVVVILGADGNPITTIVNTGKEFDPSTGMMKDISKSSSATTAAPPDRAEPPPAAGAPNPTPRGPGMGGSLRKF
jgi:hypothetical protein